MAQVPSEGSPPKEEGELKNLPFLQAQALCREAVRGWKAACDDLCPCQEDMVKHYHAGEYFGELALLTKASHPDLGSFQRQRRGLRFF